MSSKKDISIEIQNIFDKNTLDDLNRFLNKRKCLNTTNMYFKYLFYFVQSSGILTTSFAAGTNNQPLVWTGIGLNILASLIHIYERLNNSMMKKLMHDINLIKDGSYVDESEIIEEDRKNSSMSVT